MKRISMLSLAAVLIVAPLFLGGNRALFWAVNEILVALAVLAVLVNKKLGREFWSAPSMMLLLSLFVAPLAWMALQLTPNLPAALAHQTWRAVPEGAATISADPASTWLALLWWLPMSIVFVAVALGRRSYRIRTYLTLISVMAVFEALFGLANLYFGWNTVGLTEQQSYRGFLTGTFVNRNSAASFLGMGLTALSCLTVLKLKQLRKSHRHKNNLVGMFLTATSSIAYNVAAMSLIFVALLLTGSRAGVICALLAQAIVFFYAAPDLTLRRAALPSVAAIALVFLGISVSALLERANGGAQSAQSRFGMAQDAIAVIITRPLLGHGAGSYQTVEPITRIASVEGNYVLNRPHNSYLEAAATLGIPFTVGWILAFVLLSYRIWKGTVRRKSEPFRPATVAFLAILVAEGLHACVDFSMQIQANAIFAAVILGFAMAEARRANSNEIETTPAVA